MGKERIRPASQQRGRDRAGAHLPPAPAGADRNHRRHAHAKDLEEDDQRSGDPSKIDAAKKEAASGDPAPLLPARLKPIMSQARRALKGESTNKIRRSSDRQNAQRVSTWCAALRDRPRPAFISARPAIANGTSKIQAQAEDVAATMAIRNRPNGVKTGAPVREMESRKRRLRPRQQPEAKSSTARPATAKTGMKARFQHGNRHHHQEPSRYQKNQAENSHTLCLNSNTSNLRSHQLGDAWSFDINKHLFASIRTFYMACLSAARG